MTGGRVVTRIQLMRDGAEILTQKRTFPEQQTHTF